MSRLPCATERLERPSAGSICDRRSVHVNGAWADSEHSLTFGQKRTKGGKRLREKVPTGCATRCTGVRRGLHRLVPGSDGVRSRNRTSLCLRDTGESRSTRSGHLAAQRPLVAQPVGRETTPTFSLPAHTVHSCLLAEERETPAEPLLRSMSLGGTGDARCDTRCPAR